MEPPNPISDHDKLDSAGALVTTTGHTEELRASGISSDTFLYVAGNDPSAGTYFLARVNLLIGPGTLDTTFNTGSSGFVSRGTITYSPACCAVSYTPSAYALAFQDDGMVVVAGTARGCGPSTMFAMRFKHQYTSGAITDPTFNSGAEKMIDFGTASGYNAAGLAVAITNTGKIYVAGDAGAIGCGTVAFAVSRLSSAGALDSTFDSDGLLTTTSFVGYASSQINAAAILSNGKFMAAGQVVAGCCTTSDFALSKYNAPAGLEERVYAQHDANFDVTAITDTFGTVIERYLYDSYGKRTIFSSAYGGRGSSSYSFDYGFQGGQYVANAELMIFRNRYLNTSLQRWMTTDSKRYIDGLNLYWFVGDSPTDGRDPMGTNKSNDLVLKLLDLETRKDYDWSVHGNGDSKTGKWLWKQVIDTKAELDRTPTIFTVYRRQLYCDNIGVGSAAFYASGGLISHHFVAYVDQPWSNGQSVGIGATNTTAKKGMNANGYETYNSKYSYRVQYITYRRGGAVRGTTLDSYHATDDVIKNAIIGFPLQHDYGSSGWPYVHYDCQDWALGAVQAAGLTARSE